MAPRPVSGGYRVRDAGSLPSSNKTDALHSALFPEDSSEDLSSRRLHQLEARNTTRPKFCNRCVTQDTDPRLKYLGNWRLNQERDKPFSTTHSTTSTSASVSFTFNGSKIAVFGTIPQDSSSKGPTARYVIDDSINFVTTLPVANRQVRNQQFFFAEDLNTTEHTLSISMIEVNQKAPYILQSFFVQPHNQTEQIVDDVDDGGPTGPGGPGTEEPPINTNAEQTRIIRILCGVLGAVVVLIVIAAVAFLIRRRFVKSRASERIWSKFRKYSPPSKPRPETMFTSFTTTESIMRNDPASLVRGSSAFTRSDGRSDSSLQIIPPYFIPSEFRQDPEKTRI